MAKDLAKEHRFREDSAVLCLALGAMLSIVVTIAVCIWEWVENPGGIFHNTEGTNWQFVFETAVSWFIPTFVNTVVIASLGRLLWILLAVLMATVRKKEESGAL